MGWVMLTGPYHAKWMVGLRAFWVDIVKTETAVDLVKTETPCI